MAAVRTTGLLIALLATVAAAGCSLNNVREIQPDQPFLGLEDLFEITTGPPASARLNAVFVHGMGHHPFGEPGVRRYQKRIAEELGFSRENVRRVEWGPLRPGKKIKSDIQVQLKREGLAGSVSEQELLDELTQEGQTVCPLRINDVIVGYVGWRQYEEKSGSGTRVLNLFELSWDRATEILQKTILELNEDYKETVELRDDLKPQPNGRDREADRALVNGWLKSFVNRQLGDPTLYLGAYGNSIRRTVADGLLKVASVPGADEASPYTIISDSLGSRIVFDTLRCALIPSSRKECKHFCAETKLSKLQTEQIKPFARNTVQVFMNANQLPFLALSEATAPRPGETEEDWLRRLPCEPSTSVFRQFQDAVNHSRGEALRRNLKERGPVRIIAFNDPNDALSYHLTTRFRNRDSVTADDDDGSPSQFVNVRITNA